MTLTIEQLEVLSKALHSPDLDYHQLSITGEAVRALDMEIERRKHGPFTLAEARVSGKLYRRTHWPAGCYYMLQDADESSHMAFAECINNKKPVAYDEDRMDRKVFADDITATDYELMPEGGE